MSVVGFFSKCLADCHTSLVSTTEGLTVAELSWQPKAGCNSIGFLVWHHARVLDNWFYNRIQKKPQLWQQGWAERCGRSPSSPTDIGWRFTAEQVDDFRVPKISVLLQYVEAVHAGVDGYLEGKDDSILESVTFLVAGGSAVSLVTLFEQLVWELNQHGGQMAYLRGIQRGIEEKFIRGPALDAITSIDSLGAD